MKELYIYISEKLHLNKDIKISDDFKFSEIENTIKDTLLNDFDLPFRMHYCNENDIVVDKLNNARKIMIYLKDDYCYDKKLYEKLINNLKNKLDDFVIKFEIIENTVKSGAYKLIVSIKK